ncbi:MAG TPA: NAD(P)-dependent oxidoreductase [Mycobacteriales bacterium]
MTSVAVLGTGVMGAGMARSLLRAGHSVAVWNRSRTRAEPLASDGATVAASPAEAVAGAGVVVTMLFDADATGDVVGAAAEAFGPDTVWLQTATVGPDGMARLGDLAAKHGIAVLDAPVLGTKGPAEQGTLTMLVSGDPSLVERVRPVLDAVGARTVVAGDRLGLASGLKLACNSLIAAQTAAIGQALALARALGVDPALVLEAFDGAAANSPYLQVKGKQVLAGEHPTSFAVDGVVKDVGLMLDAAQDAGVPDALLRAVRDAFAEASAAGHGDADMSAVAYSFTPKP